MVRTGERLDVRAGTARTGGLAHAATVSAALALLMGVTSVVGLAVPEIYPVDVRESFVPNDAVNVALGVPALLVAAWQGWRGSLLAMLAWPGVLGYVTYNYLAYLVGLPFGWLGVLAGLLVAGSVWGVVAVLRRVDGHAVRDVLAGAVPIRLGGWVVAAFGAVFAARAGAMLVSPPAGDAAGPADLGVLVADLAVSAAWFVGGVAMVRRRAAGYAAGLGLLVLANMLFTGLVAFMLLQPALTGASLVSGDLAMVAAMWPAALVPGVLFVRGVAASRRGVASRGRAAGRPGS